MTTNDSSETTHATVITDRPERYAKQLASHLGRRHGGECSSQINTGWIDFGPGHATITAAGDQLQLAITAPCDYLSRLEEVAGVFSSGSVNEASSRWSGGGIKPVRR